MSKTLTEFRAFAMRGNVVDLAVAVIIGTAFGKIVSSLVENVVTPLIGLLLGGVDLTQLSVSVRDAVIEYGVFLQSVVDFIIIAAAVFLAMKGINALKRRHANEPAPPAPPSREEELLTEIRDALRTK